MSLPPSPAWPRAFVAVAVLLALAPFPPADAQVEPGAELQLVGQPVWHRPGDPLGLELRITNLSDSPLVGFRVSVSAYDRTTSRSALHESFSGGTGLPSSYPKDFLETVVDPGDSVTQLIDEPVESLATFAAAAESGVYPLNVSLYDASGTTVLDEIETDILFFPRPPENRLNLVLVWPINTTPARGPDGIFHTDPAGAWPLEEALGPSGWLTTTLAALARQTSGRARNRLHLGVAPTPRLLEEITDMSDGYTRADEGDPERVERSSSSAQDAAAFQRQLLQILSTGGVQPLFAPYAAPDLPAIADDVDRTNLQLSVGETVLTESLPGISFNDRWLFPAAGRLDAKTLDLLQSAPGGTANPAGTAARSFFSSDSLVPPEDPSAAGCPQSFASFTCPVQVATSRGATTGYVADAGLQERLAELAQPGDDRIHLQRFFAELAMIWAEIPNQADRVVQATLPPSWRPPAAIADQFFNGLSGAPWLETMAPAEALKKSVPPSPQPLVEIIDPSPRQPDAAYTASLDEAQQVVDSFARMRPPAQLVDRLSRNVLVAQSRSWWGSPDLVEEGEDFASTAQEEAQDEMNKVKVGGGGQITLTSRRATIPLTLENDTGYDVTLNIRLSSPDLLLERSDITERFSPGINPLHIEATAEASGIFPLTVTISTPDGYLIERTDVAVRSTEFNTVAVTITIGAFAFLVLFYLLRGIKRRANRRRADQAQPA